MDRDTELTLDGLLPVLTEVLTLVVEGLAVLAVLPVPVLPVEAEELEVEVEVEVLELVLVLVLVLELVEVLMEDVEATLLFRLPPPGTKMQPIPREIPAAFDGGEIGVGAGVMGASGLTGAKRFPTMLVLPK